MLQFSKIRETIKRHLALYKSLYKDKRTPWISKIFLWLALAYLAMPFDLIPDFIPVLGQLDDLVIVPALIYVSVKFIPKKLYREHYNRTFGKP